MDSDEWHQCRLCFANGHNYIDLFDGTEYSSFVISVLREHIAEVKENDLFPKYLCIVCWNKTGKFHSFHRAVQTAQANYLLQYGKNDISDCTDVNQTDEENQMKLTNFIEIPQCGTEFDSERIDAEFANVFQNIESHPVRSSNEYLTEVKIVGPMLENEEEIVDECNVSIEKFDKTEDLTDAKPTDMANFDYTCDVCGIDQYTFDQSILHYSQEHSQAGYIKCCGKKFFKECTVEDHKMFHKNPNIFKCKICGAQLGTRKSYYKHNSWHNGPQRFICDICDRPFNYKESLKLHMYRYHIKGRNINEAKCPACLSRFPTSKTLEAHEALCRGSDAAKTAKEQLANLKNIITSLSTSDIQKVVAEHFDMSCDLCGDDFVATSLVESQYHYMNEHHVTDGYIKCCDLRLKHQDQILEHVPYHINENLCKCKVCGKEKKTIRRMRSHLELHMKRGSYRCNECSATFVRENYLVIHMNRNHVKAKRNKNELNELENRPDPQEYFDMRCDHDTCENVRFTSLQDAKLHYLKEHNNPDGYLKCCGIVCKTTNQVNDHLLFHMNPNHFKCSYCEKSFTTHKTLQSHKSKHKAIESKFYSCEICQKSYASNHNLKLHLKTHEKKEPKKREEGNFPCSFCFRKFKSESVKKSHEDRIHLKIADDEDKQEICEFCAKRFRRKEIANHIRKMHTPGNPRQTYTCEICNTTLSSQYTLKTHMLKHTSDPQKCPHCYKLSANEEALKQHIRKNHLQKAIHKCNLCEKSFKDITSLKSHTGTHTGEKMFKCSYCPEEFVWRPNMYAHQKKMHPIEWSEKKNKRQIIPKIK